MPFTHGTDIGEMAARDSHTDIEVVDGGGAGKTGFVHPRLNSRPPHLLQGYCVGFLIEIWISSALPVDVSSRSCFSSHLHCTGKGITRVIIKTTIAGRKYPAGCVPSTIRTSWSVGPYSSKTWRSMAASVASIRRSISSRVRAVSGIVILYVCNGVLVLVLIGGVLPASLQQQNLDTISAHSIDRLEHIDFALTSLINEARCDADDISLFRDIAGDIAYAVNALRVEESAIAAHRAQQESRDKYERLFNNAEDAIFLHEITDDGLPGRIVEVNHAACRRQGYTREEFPDMSVPGINTPSDKGKAPDIVRKLLETNHLTFEGFHVRTDGSVFPMEVAAHLFTMDDHPLVPAIRRDITGRKEMEEQIRAALARTE